MIIQIGDAHIYSVAFGPAAAPAILGIGGWIGSWDLWADPFSELSQVYRTIGYDHRGCGMTVAPVESITMERLRADVFAVLDAYEVESCILAAESAGALTALSAALQQPQRIRGLVIVDGLYYAPPLSAQDGFLNALRQAYEPTLDHFVDACVPEPDSQALKAWGKQLLRRAAPEAAIQLYRLNSTIDLRPDLPSITQPTLILHGSADALVPLQAAQWLAQTLPNAQLKVIEGAGHVPTVTRPQEVAQAIIEFFAPG